MSSLKSGLSCLALLHLSESVPDALHVRFWHKADIPCAPHMSAFGGKADIRVDAPLPKPIRMRLLAFPIIAVVAVLTAKVRRQE